MTVPTIFEGISAQPEATSVDGLFFAAESADVNEPTKKVPINLVTQETLRFTGIVYKASGINSAVKNMVDGITIQINVGETCKCEHGTIFKRAGNATGGISDYDAISDVKVMDFGIYGVSDDTLMISYLFDSIKSGYTIDLQGMTISQSNQGTNFNPFRSDGAQNQTTYAFLEKKNDVTFKNGKLTANLNMQSECLNLTGFSGCDGITFDDIELNIQAYGVPVFANNGYETWAALINFRNHEDGTIGKNLTIKSTCRLRVNHPDGASIGGKSTNPVHNYSGKLVGVIFYGDYSAISPLPVDGLIIEDGVKFTECTARVVWCWVYKNITIGDVNYVDCGTPSGKSHSMLRMLHSGDNVKIGRQTCTNCHVSDDTGLWIVSNNNSNGHPKNISSETWNIINCSGGSGWVFADGQAVALSDFNVSDSEFLKCVNFFDGNNSDYKKITTGIIKNVQGTQSTLLNISTENGDEFVIGGLIGNGESSANSAYTVNHQSGIVTVKLARLYGYTDAIFGSVNAGPIKLIDFDLSNNAGSGLSYSTPSMVGSKFKNGKANGNQNLGMRLPESSKSSDIHAKGNAGDQFKLNLNAEITNYSVDDGPLTLTTSSGLINETGIDGQIAKGGIVRSTSGKFKYGIDLNTTATIVHNTFIGNVGTSAKWRTFGGSTVVGNTPSDNP